MEAFDMFVNNLIQLAKINQKKYEEVKMLLHANEKDDDMRRVFEVAFRISDHYSIKSVNANK